MVRYHFERFGLAIVADIWCLGRGRFYLEKWIDLCHGKHRPRYKQSRDWGIAEVLRKLGNLLRFSFVLHLTIWALAFFVKFILSAVKTFWDLYICRAGLIFICRPLWRRWISMGTEWSTTENSIKWCQTCLKWFDISSNSTIMTLHFGRKGSVLAQTLNMNSTSYKLVPSRLFRLASKFLMTHLGVDQKQYEWTHTRP